MPIVLIADRVNRQVAKHPNKKSHFSDQLKEKNNNNADVPRSANGSTSRSKRCQTTKTERDLRTTIASVSSRAQRFNLATSVRRRSFSLLLFCFSSTNVFFAAVTNWSKSTTTNGISIAICTNCRTFRCRRKRRNSSRSLRA